MAESLLILPRPGSISKDKTTSIAAPTETEFTSTFGNLLPPATYLQHEYGKAAYYSIPPSRQSSGQPTPPISRVLMIHGVQTSAIGIQPLAKELSFRFPGAHIVLFDLWGHGLTDTPLRPHEPALFHSLIEALLVELKWENAHFIGYSFGGTTTVTYALAKPHRVASMTLVATAGLLHPELFGADHKDWWLHPEVDQEAEAHAGILNFMEGGPLVVPSDWKERFAKGEVVAEAVRDWEMKQHKGHPASVVAIWRDGGVMNKYAEFAQASRLGIENVVILGELDRVCAVKDLTEAGMTNVVVVPQAGHALVRTHKLEVAQAIENFWRNM